MDVGDYVNVQSYIVYDGTIPFTDSPPKDISCKAWPVDPSIFLLPSGVKVKNDGPVLRREATAVKLSLCCKSVQELSYFRYLVLRENVVRRQNLRSLKLDFVYASEQNVNLGRA
jgi:hypothetical protein